MSTPKQQRRLTAIMAADVAGYTRAMAADEAGTLARLQALIRDIVAPAVEAQGGRIFKEMGDGILAEFPSAVDAVRCAVAIQSTMATAKPALTLRIGLHVGDVIIEGDDLFGDGVNIAARLEAEAEPGSIVVSDAFRNHAEGRAGVAFTDLGMRHLKNIDRPVRVHQLTGEGAPETPPAKPSPRNRRLATPLIGVVAMVLVLLAGWAAWTYFDDRQTSPAQASGTPAIAVVPFDNLSADAEQAYFADGLAEDLITDLSKIEGIRVVSRTSSFAYRSGTVPMNEIARRLSVRYLVEGSVRRAGNALRITASLIDTLNDTPIWSERFDGSDGDVFGFQDRITGQIITALRVQLTPAEQQAVGRRGTTDPAAYDAYLQGLRLLAERRRLDTEANAAAQLAFREAIRLDPDYALAYAGLAWAKWIYIESIYVLGGEAATGQAFGFAEKSLALKDNALAHRTLAKRHLALMSFYVKTTKRADLAVTELEAAQRLQPNNPDVLADLATALSFAGRPADALELVQKAMELNPSHPPWYFAASGIARLLTGDTKVAIRDLKRWSDDVPNWNVPYMFLASAYGLAGQAEAAKAAFERHTYLIQSAKMTSYAVKRQWPMAPVEEETFLRGLRAAGVKDTPG